MPPKHGADTENAGRNEQKEKRGVFDPGDGWNTESHDQAEKAHLPGQQVHARSKRAERQQGEDRESGRVGAEIPLHCRQQQHVYDNDECEPVQRLRRNQAPAGGGVARVVPAGADADQHNEGNEDFPVGLDRLPRESRVGNPEDGQDQHNSGNS
jgi:hypothetical protein